MKDSITYLDSSSIVKRYVEEPGTRIVRDVYLKAYSGELTVAFSSWNIGEVIGAFDKSSVRGVLSHESHLNAKNRFLIETRRLTRLGVLWLIPVRLKLLTKSWDLIERYHIYQADALQIVSAKTVNATQFFTSDKRVCEIAGREGLNSVLIM
ncbi:MAG: type II toxin-antitoxin system VapC family toxin [Candidatus Bathyarchaeia archaeon]|nr:type II toxin-antitoxin system VapC family toxin [Candidatus Bathyarchaeota archaeon]